MNAIELKNLREKLTAGPYVLSQDVENHERDKRMKYGCWSNVLPVAKKGELFIIDISIEVDDIAMTRIVRGTGGGNGEYLTKHSPDFVKNVAEALVPSIDPWHRILARTANVGSDMRHIGDDVVEKLLRTGVVTEDQVNTAVLLVLNADWKPAQ